MEKSQKKRLDLDLVAGQDIRLLAAGGIVFFVLFFFFFSLHRSWPFSHGSGLKLAKCP